MPHSRRGRLCCSASFALHVGMQLTFAARGSLRCAAVGLLQLPMPELVVQVDGNRPMEEVFASIDALLTAHTSVI